MLNNNGGKGFGKDARKLAAPSPVEQARQALIHMHFEDQVNELVEWGKENSDAGTIVMRDDLAETWTSSVGLIYVFAMTNLDGTEAGIAARFSLEDGTMKTDELVVHLGAALSVRAKEQSDTREFPFRFGYVPSINCLIRFGANAQRIKELGIHWDTSDLKQDVLEYIAEMEKLD